MFQKSNTVKQTDVSENKWW